MEYKLKVRITPDFRARANSEGTTPELLVSYIVREFGRAQGKPFATLAAERGLTPSQLAETKMADYLRSNPGRRLSGSTV